MKKTYTAAFALLAMVLTAGCSKKEAPVEAESIPVEDVMDQEGNIDSAFAALDDDSPLAKSMADSIKVAKADTLKAKDESKKKEAKKKDKKKEAKKESDSESK